MKDFRIVVAGDNRDQINLVIGPCSLLESSRKMPEIGQSIYWKGVEFGQIDNHINMYWGTIYWCYLFYINTIPFASSIYSPTSPPIGHRCYEPFCQFLFSMFDEFLIQFGLLGSKNLFIALWFKETDHFIQFTHIFRTILSILYQLPEIQLSNCYSVSDWNLH